MLYNTITQHIILFIPGFIAMILIAFIAWQDFRTFKISLWLLISCFILFSISSIIHLDLWHFLIRLLINCSFVLLLLSVVWIYFRFKKQESVKMIDEIIGWGDILFFLVITPIMGIMNYILFLTISFAIGITYSFTVRMIKKSFQKIPLAGIMAFLLLLIAIQSFFTKNSAYLQEYSFGVNNFENQFTIW